MAASGVKPKPHALRGLKAGKRGDDTELPGERKEFSLEPPVKFTKTEQWIWDHQIKPAYWLEQADMLTILAYVYLSAELIEQKFNVPTRRVEEWRRMGNELVLTTAEQVRVGLRNVGPDASEPGPDDGKKDFFG